MSRGKLKKQFRLYDIYRYRVMGIQSHIKGIKSYRVTESTVHVTFVNDSVGCEFYHDEEDLKEIVKHVNKVLCNCDKPGPRVHTDPAQLRILA